MFKMVYFERLGGRCHKTPLVIPRQLESVRHLDDDAKAGDDRHRC